MGKKNKTTSLKLFLAGLPGTGKTEFGNFLAQKNGFVHFDLEKPIWPQPELSPIWEKSRSEFIANIKGEKVILNWGFPANCTNWVREILDGGFAFIWFTGREECAKKWFLKRENNQSLASFDGQVKSIRENNIPGSLERRVIEIDVFKDDCVFKNKEDIFLKIIQELKTKVF